MTGFFTGTSPGASPRGMARAVRHVGLVVVGLDAMLAFYTGLLGLAVRARAEESGAFVDGLLGFPDVRVTTVKLAAAEGPTLVELLCFSHPESPPARRLAATNSLGPTHVAFTVDDLDALWRRACALGIVFNAPPLQSPDGRVKAAYCRDPEGNFVELVEMLEDLP